MKNEITYKQLQTVLNTKEAELETLKIQLNSLQQEYQSKKRNVDELKRKIENFNVDNNKPLITEHAILRYL